MYAQLIKQLYPNLDPNKLYQLKLNDEEVKVTDLQFIKECSKYSKVSIQENDVVKCVGWYENSKEKNSCTYRIHKNSDCYQTVSNVNYCPNCYILHQSNISNDNSSREMNNNLRQYHSDDDHISYNYDKAEDKSVA